MKSVKKDLKIINKLGLHARAAGQFRHTAAKYDSDIEVTRNNMSVNAKSLLGLMALEAYEGVSIQVIARGEDAEEAVAELDKLVKERFGEKE